MNILVIGEKLFTDYALQALDDTAHMVDVYYWDGTFGPELLMDSGINDYDSIVVMFDDDKLSADITVMIKTIVTNDSCTVFDYILWHKAMLPAMRADLVMSNPLHHSYDGLILGLSHAEVGILADRLQGHYANLAVSSQDIYYNYKTLEYCIDNYWEKIKDLKHIIIDMYDYEYFNFDTSLAKNIYRYFMWGGYNLDEHNMTRNKIYKNSLEEVRNYLLYSKYKGLDISKLGMWKDLFPDTYYMNGYADYRGVNRVEQRMEMITDRLVEEYEVTSSTVRNEYPETISENVSVMNDMLALIYSKWPDIKVNIILLPIYKGILDKREPYYIKWKEQFMGVIENLSFLIMTDSGGVQEEAPSLGKPVLVLRENTERPEGVAAGTLKLVGVEKESIYIGVKELLDNRETYIKMSKASNPYGDGNASKYIVDALLKIMR